MMKHRNHRCFTLAEALITLGVIGVVAALTMPALIVSYRKIVVETHLKRFYSNINQAIKLSEIDNGDKKEWVFAGGTVVDEQGIGTYPDPTDWYNKYLAPYLKTLSVSYTDEMVPFGDGTRKGMLKVKFVDGSINVITTSGADHAYCLTAKDAEAGRSKLGVNCFMFGFYPTRSETPQIKQTYYDKGVEPYVSSSWNGTYEDLKTRKLYTKIIYLHNWKIPDDYPLKF
ncbi:MAG: type II secretion system GspH family protein [Heliobacteriaceae bacterium]|jgi:type II secretory pathway pseudopilin PulG|nr:type II secretion system GspH family protein [Heliobacteriaceae bacterium]